MVRPVAECDGQACATGQSSLLPLRYITDRLALHQANTSYPNAHLGRTPTLPQYDWRLLSAKAGSLPRSTSSSSGQVDLGATTHHRVMYYFTASATALQVRCQSLRAGIKALVVHS